MPLWFYNENGQYYGEHSTPYPAPEHIVDNLRVTLPEGHTFVDVPPLSPEFYHFPEGASGPVARPVFEFKLDKATVVGDGRDRIYIAGVPVGTVVHVYGPIQAELMVGDDSFTVGFVHPGSYQIRFTAPPHRSVTLPFTVLEAGEVEHGHTDRPDVTVEPDRGAYAARAEAVLAAAFTPRDPGFATSPSDAEAYIDGRGGKRLEARIDAEAEAHNISAEELALAVVQAADDAHAMAVRRIAVIRAFRELVAGGADVLDMDAYLTENGLQPLPKLV